MDIFSLTHLEQAFRLLMAILLGGLIGFERETKGKQAGLRTHTVVSVASALVMLVSLEIFDQFRNITAMDPARIAAQVVSGIGFLGAGAIIRSPQGVSGLTTAAGLWAASAIGLACGMGLYYLAIMATVLILIILIIFSKIDRFFAGKDH